VIRVLVVERPGSDRERLAALLGTDPQISIVAEIVRPAEVVEQTRKVRPAVIAMAVQLPATSTFDLTKEIMIEAPTPIVIVSDETDARQVEVSILALRAGALAVAPRPPAVSAPDHEAARDRLIATVIAMSQVKVVRRWRERPQALPRGSGSSRASTNGTSAHAVAIAASTGGPAALQQLLSELPADFPAPILVVQHIADGFIGGLVDWLNSICSLKVKVAEGGEPLAPHTVYVAPSNSHLGVAGRARITLSHADPIGGFRPSASFLFESVARAFGSSSIHVVLTGMGQDGLAGLMVARELGGRILAQDEASSVVFGMPGAAIAAGVVDHVMPPAAAALQLLALTRA
jgi:two-component system, chemotaxis family, protein-glutamate methylesterase/glutaminase